MHFISKQSLSSHLFIEETTQYNSYCCNQGIIVSTGKETWKILPRMFVMAKSFDELFTPTLIAVTV